jgi:hypothetical protein
VPFTPFHIGLGILVKALLQSSFSLMVFGWTQIVMDIQPLIFLISGEGHLHVFFSHVYWRNLIGYCSRAFWSIPVNIPWWVVFLSAFIGSFSHVLLDSIMHLDIQLFFPITLNNALLDVVSTPVLHKIWLYSGLAGATLYYFLQWRHKNT